MAKKITIDIEVNGKMQRATLSAKKLRAALDGADDAYQRTGNSARNYDRNTKGAAKTTSNSTKEFSKMAQGMGGLVGAYATVAASVFALSAAFNFFKQAADLAALTAGQELFAQRTGVSMKLMTANIQDATGGLVAFKEAAQAAAIGQAAGLTADQMERLGKVAKNAGTILGRDVTDSFNRLTRGAIKAEPELLDELGIIVRIADAAEEYGRKIGKNAQDLTQFEKSQAVVNAVLEQGEGKFQDIGDSVNQVAKFGAAFQNTFKKLSEPVADIANFIAGALQDSILAVSAVIGLLGLNIVKAFAPAGPALKNTAEEGINARKRLMDAAQTETDSVIAGEIRKGEFTNRNLKAIERAASSKTSTVINLSKMEKTAIERDVAIIRAQNLRMSMHGQNVFKQMVTSWRIQSLMFQAEYGKVLGRMRMYTAAFASFASRALSILSFAGIVVMLIELGKQARKAFFISPELRKAEEGTEALTKAVKDQIEAIEEVESSLKEPTSALNGLNQQLGVLANFNLGPAIRQVNLFTEAIQRLENAERQRAQAAAGAEDEGPRRVGDDARIVKQKGQASRSAPAFLKQIDTIGDLNAEILENERNLARLQEKFDETTQTMSRTEVLIARATGQFSELSAATRKQAQLQDAVNRQNAIRVIDTDEGRQSLEILKGIDTTLPLLEKNMEQLQALGLVDNELTGQFEELKSALVDTFAVAQGAGSNSIAEFGDQAEAAQILYKAFVETLEDGNESGARLKSTFQGLTNASQAFTEGAEKFLPKQSQFTQVFQALDNASNELANMIDLSSKISGMGEDVPTLGELFKDEKGILDEEERAIQAIFDVAIQGSEKFKGKRLEELTVAELQLLVEEKRAALTKAYQTLELQGGRLRIKQLETSRQALNFQKGLVSAINAADNAQQKLNVAEQELTTFLENNRNLTEEQKEAAKLKRDEAKAAVTVAEQELALQRQLLPILQQQAQAKMGVQALELLKQINSELNKEISLRKEILDLDKSLAEQRIEEEIADLAQKSPFFDKERATAEAKLALEEAFLERNQQAVLAEYDTKVASINLEYALLEAKRKIALLELEASAKRAESTNTDEGRELAASYRALAEVQGTIDFEGPRQAAIDLANKAKEASLYGLDKAVRDAKRAVEALDPMEQVFQKTAESFKSGLSDAIHAGFTALTDGTKSFGDSLKDITKGIVQTIQKEAINRLIVNPLLDTLFSEDSQATQIAKAHATGMKAGSTSISSVLSTGNTSLNTTFTTGSNSIRAALRLGGADLARMIKDALRPPEFRELPEPGPQPQDTFGQPRLIQTAGPVGGGLIDQITGGVNPQASDGNISVPGRDSPGHTDLDPGNAATQENTNALTSVTEALLGTNEGLGANVAQLGIAAIALSGNSKAAQILGKAMLVLQAVQIAMKIATHLNTLAVTANTAAQAAEGGGSVVKLLTAKMGHIPNTTAGYSRGGIAKGPMSGYPAILHGNEAVVPLPDGRTIPVELDAPKMSGGMGQQNNVTVNVSVDGNGAAQTSADSRDAAQLGTAISDAVQRELVNQKRPGGILSPYGAR